MPHKLVDLRCEACNHIWETLLMPNEDLQGCPECGSLRVCQEPGGNPTTLHDPNARSTALKKRSADHSARTFGENVERLKAEGRLPSNK
jgi:hypothetical protein